MVTGLRGKVDAVMGEVPCSECGGSRLADVASAVTLWGRSLDVWCRMPLGRLEQELAAFASEPGSTVLFAAGMSAVLVSRQGVLRSLGCVTSTFDLPRNEACRPGFMALPQLLTLQPGANVATALEMSVSGADCACWGGFSGGAILKYVRGPDSLLPAE